MLSDSYARYGVSAWLVSYRCERHLRELVREFTAHYHTERNHQSLDNKLITPGNDNAAISGRVVRRQRLGGVLNFYCREAA